MAAAAADQVGVALAVVDEGEGPKASTVGMGTTRHSISNPSITIVSMHLHRITGIHKHPRTPHHEVADRGDPEQRNRDALGRCRLGIRVLL